MVGDRAAESASGVTQYQFAKIVTAKDHRLNGFVNRVLFSHHSEAGVQDQGLVSR